MSEAQDGLPLPRRYWAMLAQALAVTIAVLDGSIANIALPSIATNLAIDPADSIWVVNAYQLAITISLLPLAAMGDLYGYRRIYGWGVVVFTLASLACALSNGLLELTLARVVQGFGAAGLMSVNTALVRFIFPRAQLGRGMGINSLVVALSSAAGPSIGAFILHVASWPALFLVNLPIGVAALAMIRTLPKTPRPGGRFHWVSALLNAATFGLLIVAVDEMGHGDSWLLAFLLLAAAAAVGAFFIRTQLALAAPMLPVDLFRNPAFALSVLTSVSSFVAASMAFIAMPFLFEAGGIDTMSVGLLITPWPATSAVIAPIAGRLSDRLPAGILGGAGLIALTIGLIAIALTPASPALWDAAWRMALCGAGFALFQTPNNRLLIAAAPRDRSGAASGMLSTARLLGQTLGAAFVAVIFAATSAAGIAHGATTAIIVGAGFAFMATLVSLLRLRL